MRVNFKNEDAQTEWKKKFYLIKQRKLLNKYLSKQSKRRRTFNLQYTLKRYKYIYIVNIKFC